MFQVRGFGSGSPSDVHSVVAPSIRNQEFRQGTVFRPRLLSHFQLVRALERRGVVQLLSKTLGIIEWTIDRLG